MGEFEAEVLTDKEVEPMPLLGNASRSPPKITLSSLGSGVCHCLSVTALILAMTLLVLILVLGNRSSCSSEIEGFLGPTDFTLGPLASARANSRSISLLSLNCWQLPPPLVTYARERIELLTSEDNLDKYDVLALQEMFAWGSDKQDSVIVAASQLGFGYYARPDCPSWGDGALIDSGLVLISRYPLHNVSFTQYDAAAWNTADTHAAKGFLSATIEPYENCSMSITVTHMQAHSSPAYEAVRDKQRAQMVEVLSSRPDWGKTPSLIVGDFNVPAGIDRDMTEHDAMMEQIESLGLVDVTHTLWMGRNPSGEAPDDGSDPEWPRTSAGGVVNEEIKRNKQIDYVFGGGIGFTFNTTESPVTADSRLVVRSSFVDPLDAPEEDPFARASDHLGITFLGTCLE